MGIETIWRRASGAVLCAGMALLLTGCFLSPGKFESSLDLRKDGRFTFSYQGEIYMLGMTRLAEMGASAAGDEFVETGCYDEETYAERPCTDAEIEQQRADWEVRQVAEKEEDERNMKMFGATFGGLDPSDPKTAEDLAKRLSRQKGWNKVTYKGDGLYDVDFSISSTMTHDFAFPTIEGFMMSNGFVNAAVRAENSVRIDAPAFSMQASSTGAPSGNMLQLAALVGEEKSGKSAPVIPELGGTFTITTDGAILANNTDEGPVAIPGGQRLSWTVTARSTAAPMALIRLGE